MADGTVGGECASRHRAALCRDRTSDGTGSDSQRRQSGGRALSGRRCWRPNISGEPKCSAALYTRSLQPSACVVQKNLLGNLSKGNLQKCSLGAAYVAVPIQCAIDTRARYAVDVNTVCAHTQTYTHTQTTTDAEANVMFRTTKCPLHPSPSPLPTPLPQAIQSVITSLEDNLANLVDAETMVCM